MKTLLLALLTMVSTSVFANDCYYTVAHCTFDYGNFDFQPSPVAVGKVAGKSGFFIFGKDEDAAVLFYELPSGKKLVTDGSVKYGAYKDFEIQFHKGTPDLIYVGTVNPSSVQLISRGERRSADLRDLYESVLKKRYSQCLAQGDGSYENAIQSVIQRRDFAIPASDFLAKAKACDTVFPSHKSEPKTSSEADDKEPKSAPVN